MAQVHETLFFEIKIDIPKIWDKGTPSFRNKRAEMCYLYRRTGPLLSYTVHPPYVTDHVSRDILPNALSHSWATPGARSAVTPPLPDANLSLALSEYLGHDPVTAWATFPPLPRRTGRRVLAYPFDAELALAMYGHPQF